MINQTWLIAPTAVPVEVMTQVGCWDEGPPFSVCRLLPAGQLVEGGDDGVADESEIGALTATKADNPTAANNAPIRRRRLPVKFEICMSDGLLVFAQLRVMPRCFFSNEQVNTS
jgi:hypothetical protein